jgi:hypothetical protein
MCRSKVKRKKEKKRKEVPRNRNKGDDHICFDRNRFLLVNFI